MLEEMCISRLGRRMLMIDIPMQLEDAYNWANTYMYHGFSDIDIQSTWSA